MSSADLGKESTSSMGQVARFARDDVHFVNGGEEWLQAGYITQDFDMYPDAHVYKDLYFESSSIKGALAAYSPSLGLWVFTSHGTTDTEKSKKVYLSSDDLDTVELITVSKTMKSSSIIWSEFHGKFFVASFDFSASNAKNHILSSTDGRTWINHDIVVDQAGYVAEGENGRIFAMLPSSDTVIYSDDGFSTISPANEHSGQRTQVSFIVNAKELGIFFFEGSKVYRSTDNGETSTILNTGVNIDAAVYSENLKTIIAAGPKDIYHCTDGINFVDMTVGDPGTGSSTVSEMIVYGEDIFMKKSSTIYHSVDGINFVNKSSVANYLEGMVANDNILVISASGSSSLQISKYWFEYIGSDNATPIVNGINDYVRIK